MKTTLCCSAGALLLVVCFVVCRPKSPPSERALPPSAERSSSFATSTISAALPTRDAAPRAELPPEFVRWRDAPVSPQRTQQLAALLEVLATRDPQLAIQLASNEPASDTRAQFWHAVLRGWATADLDAATRWALEHRALTPTEAFAALASGAVAAPEAADAWAARTTAAHPEFANEIGLSLVHALAASDEFSRAATFATHAAPELRRNFVPAVFSAWARHEPEEALITALAVTDAANRALAVRAALIAWAETDPVSFAQQVTALPPGEERTFALSLLASAAAE